MKLKVKAKATQSPRIAGVNNGENKCYLGISLSNPFIPTKKLKAFLDWVIDQNYDECLILVGDYLHRFNEFIFFGKDIEGQNGRQSEAEEKGRLLGYMISKEVNQVLQQYPNKKFRLCHWKDFLQSHNNYSEVYGNIKLEFEQSNEFRNAIEKCAKSFVDKKKKEGYLYVSEQLAFEKSIQYILEELAVFSLLISDGFYTKMYIGTILPVLKDIALDKFPGFKTNLDQGRYIELQIKNSK